MCAIIIDYCYSGGGGGVVYTSEIQVCARWGVTKWVFFCATPLGYRSIIIYCCSVAVSGIESAQKQSHFRQKRRLQRSVRIKNLRPHLSVLHNTSRVRALKVQNNNISYPPLLYVRINIVPARWGNAFPVGVSHQLRVSHVSILTIVVVSRTGANVMMMFDAMRRRRRTGTANNSVCYKNKWSSTIKMI